MAHFVERDKPPSQPEIQPNPFLTRSVSEAEPVASDAPDLHFALKNAEETDDAFA